MEQFTFSWLDFIKVGIALVAIYTVLRLLLSILKYAYFGGQSGKEIANYLKPFVGFFEILCYIILSVVFILINPLMHGIIAILLGLFSFQIIRDFINGKIFHITRRMQQGYYVRIIEEVGVVQKLGLLGVSLQTNDGNKFFSYTSLLASGFTEMKGKKTGGFHQLLLTKHREELPTSFDHIDHLKGKLFICPYLDWTFKPEIRVLENSKDTYVVRALVKNDQHLNHLIQLIQEWEYSCHLEY